MPSSLYIASANWVVEPTAIAPPTTKPSGSVTRLVMSVTCEGETSCVRVPPVPNDASRRAGGREAGEADQVRRGAGRALDGGEDERGAVGVDAQPAGLDLVDGRGGAVEVGGPVAGGCRRSGRARRRLVSARDDHLVARAWSPGCRPGRCGPRRRGRGRRTSWRRRRGAMRTSPALPKVASRTPEAVRRTSTPVRPGRGGGEDVPVGGDGEVAELRLGAGRRDQLAAGRERRVEVTVGGQAGDEQRRRAVDGERGPAEQDGAVGADDQRGGEDRVLGGDDEQPGYGLVGGPGRVQLAGGGEARDGGLAAGRAAGGEEAAVGRASRGRPSGRCRRQETRRGRCGPTSCRGRRSRRARRERRTGTTRT